AGNRLFGPGSDVEPRNLVSYSIGNIRAPSQHYAISALLELPAQILQTESVDSDGDRSGLDIGPRPPFRTEPGAGSNRTLDGSGQTLEVLVATLGLPALGGRADLPEEPAVREQDHLRGIEPRIEINILVPQHDLGHAGLVVDI